MADEVMAKDEGGNFPLHLEGQFGAKCVDVINLGERVETFGTKTRVSPKCALVFHTGEVDDQGQPMEMSAEFSVSMFERAGLRQFLESWRGKSYTEEQAKAGVPIHKLEGVGALLSIEHKTSGRGRTYAKFRSVSPLPKGMTTPSMIYKRAEFWMERKKEYAEEVAKYRRLTAPVAPHDDFGGEDDPDDSLPF